MRCGAKRFHVYIATEEGERSKTILARTPAEARKRIRAQCGKETHIVSVRLAKGK